MRFNWDAIIPAVGLMLDDPEIKPIKGTGFSIDRGKNDGEFTVTITKLKDPEPSPEIQPQNQQ